MVGIDVTYAVTLIEEHELRTQEFAGSKSYHAILSFQ